MKKLMLAHAITALFLIPAQAVLAADVTGLTTFSAGTPAVASQVNGNFTAVKSAVDNNHARITTLETGPSISGNITLVNSTATAGNILKGAVPFLHDFGTGNTFLGENAGNFTMTGQYNTASGANALRNNTTGDSNTANGLNALWANTTGDNNTANGRDALRNNTTGVANTASGVQALQDNTTGGSNTASGVDALQHNTTGGSNTASGVSALQHNTTGGSNTASGVSALRGNTTGGGNTAIGLWALLNKTTGNDNLAIGVYAGSNLTTGNRNIYIGHPGFAGASDDTTRIGFLQSRAFIAGIHGTTTGLADAISVVIDSDGQLGTVSSSQRFKDNIADMGDTSSVLKQLRPVTFHYKSDQNPKGRTLQYGLVAEEVAKVAPNLVAHSANGEIETVFYQNLTPMLLNEFQKQQRVIQAQAAELAKQAAVLTKQTDRVAALEKQTQEIVALKQELARTAAVVARLGQPEKVASASSASRAH